MGTAEVALPRSAGIGELRVLTAGTLLEALPGAALVAETLGLLTGESAWRGVWRGQAEEGRGSEGGRWQWRQSSASEMSGMEGRMA
jgi:hypothetical protein